MRLSWRWLTAQPTREANIKYANNILKHELRSERWYFEQRGWKIWFVERLTRTYNRVFECNFPDGNPSDMVYEWHVYQAISFVKRRRRPENQSKWDVRGKVLSGLTADDKEGKYRGKEEQEAIDSALAGN